jgi:hypothetical protein
MRETMTIEGVRLWDGAVFRGLSTLRWGTEGPDPEVESIETTSPA